MGTDRTIPGTALPGAWERSTPAVTVVPAVMFSTKSDARPSRVPVPDWGTSLSTPRCWVALPAQPFYLLSHLSEKKVFSHDCSRGGGGHMAHGSFSLHWPEGRGKGEKKNCLCSPIFVSPFPSMKESQVVSQHSSVQRGTHSVPAEIERRKSPCVRFSSLLGTAGSKI